MIKQKLSFSFKKSLTSSSFIVLLNLLIWSIISLVGFVKYLTWTESESSISIQFINKLVDFNYPEAVLEQVEISTKYEGYIVKTNKEIEKMLKLESKQIPKDIDYSKVTNLASEARQKLEKIRPKTIGQATRISGVNPADISILTIYLRKEYPHE